MEDDGGRSTGGGFQGQPSNHLQLLQLRVVVVSMGGKGQDYL